jgi:hypothetical protein
MMRSSFLGFSCLSFIPSRVISIRSFSKVKPPTHQPFLVVTWRDSRITLYTLSRKRKVHTPYWVFPG